MYNERFALSKFQKYIYIYIVASSNCSNKSALLKAVSKAFKFFFEQVKNFHDKSTFYSNYKKFWVLNNSFPVIEKLTKINEKKNAKSISTFDFSTLYTKIKHQNLLNTLYEITNFVFSGRTKRAIAYIKSSAF